MSAANMKDLPQELWLQVMFFCPENTLNKLKCLNRGIHYLVNLSYVQQIRQLSNDPHFTVYDLLNANVSWFSKCDDMITEDDTSDWYTVPRVGKDVQSSRIPKKPLDAMDWYGLDGDYETHRNDLSEWYDNVDTDFDYIDFFDSVGIVPSSDGSESATITTTAVAPTTTNTPIVVPTTPSHNGSSTPLFIKASAMMIRS